MTRIICWDLDDTLGKFRRIGYEMAGQRVPEYEMVMGVRPGIHQLLAELGAEGWQHVVTSRGSADYVRSALRAANLYSFMDEVFGGDQVEDGDYKRYSPVAHRFDLSPSEVSAQMIVIGDSPADEPTDMDGLLFIQHDNCQHCHASVTRRLLHVLMNHDRDSCCGAFQAIYAMGATRMYDDGFLRYEYKHCHLDGDRGFDLEYRTESTKRFAGPFTIPTIFNIENMETERELDPISPSDSSQDLQGERRSVRRLPP